ncbi:MAG: hypothetical protein AUG08_13930 [Acidobacteria bacterium 13_1_20CM_2_55_15]|nr:MAG: hypothetical protein AUG08_13930 [Acidobacteria bacterium 13_1_20CM_2_55_15]
MAINSNSAVNRGSGFLTAIGAVFAVVGSAAGVSTLRKAIAGIVDVKQIVLGFSMALMFAGAGIGLIVWSRVSANLSARRNETMLQNPGKPWLWRDDWAQGYARSEWKSTATMMTIIGVAFLLFSVPMLMNFPASLRRAHPLQIAVVALFPLTGVLLIGQSLMAYLRSRKFREVRLTLSALPSTLGGKFQGRVQAQFVFPSSATVDLTLSCVHSYVSGSGDNRSRWERILWQDLKTVIASNDGQASYIPVEFNIPYDAKETDTRNADDQILWKLTTKSKMPGLDFSAVFMLPVFRTALSDSSLTITAIEARDERLIDGIKPRESKIVTGASSHGGVLFYFGHARNKRVATLVTLFGAICLGAGLFFGIAGGQTFGWIIGLIPITFSGGFGILLLAFAVWLWLGTTTIEVLNRELHIRSTCLGLSRSRVIPASTIQDFQLASNLQAGDQVWYDLKLKLADGRSITATSGLEKKEAEWFRAELKKDLGVSDLLG